MVNESVFKIVSEVSDFLNNFRHDNKVFCKEMAREHRYLQNEFTGLCIEWLRTCASKDYYYDGRNEFSYKVAKDILDKVEYLR